MSSAVMAGSGCGPRAPARGRRIGDRNSPILSPPFHERDADIAADDRQESEDDERHRHRTRRLVDVRLLVRSAAERAPEGQSDQSQHVEGGQPGREERGAPEHMPQPGSPIEVRLERGREDGVLREEPREKRHARDRQSRDEERQVRRADLRTETAHLPDVLLATERVDDRARSEEEARLEEGVRHDVEHPGDERPDAAREEHVAELGDRRVGEHLLDVVLSQRRSSPRRAP